jgi:hypothetical protein
MMQRSAKEDRMRIATFGVTGIALLVSACGEPIAASPDGSAKQGRFAGIGVFEAGPLWAQMTTSPAPADPAAAKIADDEHVIVVIDSHTGEVRQCGDHSGHCVAMNPWKGAPETLPVKLAKHASDVVTENDMEPAVNSSEATK